MQSEPRNSNPSPAAKDHNCVSASMNDQVVSCEGRSPSVNAPPQVPVVPVTANVLLSRSAPRIEERTQAEIQNSRASGCQLRTRNGEIDAVSSMCSLGAYMNVSAVTRISRVRQLLTGRTAPASQNDKSNGKGTKRKRDRSAHERSDVKCTNSGRRWSGTRSKL